MNMNVTTPDKIWSVGQLCQQLGATLASQFGTIQVRGEVSGWVRAVSGHCYFSLKDSSGQLRCAMFARYANFLSWPVQDGDKVVVTAKVGVYEQRGDLQLMVQRLQPLGQGDLYQQFLQLKDKLQRQGLFAAEHKKPLPKLPTGVAIVTSLGAAALQDVITAFQRRAPYVQLMVFNTLVQGHGAAQQIRLTLAQVEQYAQRNPLTVDLVLLVRGGGSIEDLWAFNDEQLAYCLAKFPLPIVCGVGHETDFTIADFVADVRAPTPTAAAEISAPARDELLGQLNHWQLKFQKAINCWLDYQQQKIDRFSFGLTKSRENLTQQKIKLVNWQHQLKQQIKQHCQQLQQQLKQLQQTNSQLSNTYLQTESRKLTNYQQRLELVKNGYLQQQQQLLQQRQIKLMALNPQQVLQRGFAIIYAADNVVIDSVKKVVVNQPLTAQVTDGTIAIKVTE